MSRAQLWTHFPSILGLLLSRDSEPELHKNSVAQQQVVHQRHSFQDQAVFQFCGVPGVSRAMTCCSPLSSGISGRVEVVFLSRIVASISHAILAAGLWQIFRRRCVVCDALQRVAACTRMIQQLRQTWFCCSDARTHKVREVMGEGAGVPCWVVRAGLRLLVPGSRLEWHQPDARGWSLER